MSIIDQLVADMNNQKDWYVTGPDEGECTAVPHELEQRLGLPIVYGNAIDTYGNAPDNLYEKELNTPTGVPRPGSIVVWGGYAPYGIDPRYGHTAVALAGCDQNTLVILEQNWGEKVVRVHHRDYGGVKGWFYPRALEAQPAPAPAPAPVPSPPPQDPPPAAPLPDLPPAPETPPVPPVPAPAQSVDVPAPQPAVDTTTPSTDSSSTAAQPVSPDQGTHQDSPEQNIQDQIVHDANATPTVSPSQPQNSGMDKLKSRKLWATIVAYLTVVIGALAHYFSSGQTASVIGVTTAIYLAVQGQIDKELAKNG